MAVTFSTPVRTEQIQVRGVDLGVQVCGDGPPLLLLSGVFGQIETWSPVRPHFEGFQTIAFDPPGVGRSRMTSRPLTMVGLARFSTAVLDALGIGQAHVLGGSFGGAVAQQIAVMSPRRIRRLILVSTSFGGFALPGKPQALWHFVRPGGYDGEHLERHAGSMFGGRLRSEPHLARELHLRRPTTLKAATYRMFPLWAWTSLPWLPAIFQKTLVMCGDDDPITPLANHRVMASLMPRARLHVVRGGGHLMMLDSPEMVAPPIVEFLREDEDD
jgi:pimeloyl-ACP methyl ester carboxylesterase